MRWCRVKTSAGPSFARVTEDVVELVQGSPFGEWRATQERIPLAQAGLLVPVIPPVFYAIGSNYRNHVLKMAEAKGRKPLFYDRPRVGYRANSALIATGEAIVKPADASEEFQYEAELVAVVGKTLRHASKDEARDAIFGWTIGNDVSERGWQDKDQTNIRAKNCDTFKPMGPWIETEADLDSMRTRVSINGETVHDFATGDMLFDAADVIVEIARYNTLSPGDVVWLGTDERPRNIRPGDRIEIELTGLGVLANPVVAAAN
jgi:2-keto-4-pentenoate hydratase/2-oxohepta-3-ene-1,7-dioic acid hydratase in catechol pathway